MKRSGWITGVIVMQALWALALIAPELLLFALASTTAPRASSGRKLANAVLSVPALVAIISWFGLWRETLRGWWFAFLGNFGLTAILLYSLVDDGRRYIDWAMVGATQPSAVVSIPFLIPVVRRFCWHLNASQSELSA